jgi:hypothetical protein
MTPVNDNGRSRTYTNGKLYAHGTTTCFIFSA